MSEKTPDPRLPVPDRPGGHLPRLRNWPSDQENESDDASSASRRRAEQLPDSAQQGEIDDQKPKSVLKEATPHLDTVEARRRIRMVVGGVGLIGVALLVYVAVTMISRDTTPKVAADTNAASENATPPPDPAAVMRQRESDAAHLLDEAREYADRDQDAQAVVRLERLAAAFADTRAGKEGRAALERNKGGLPLFPAGEMSARRMTADASEKLETEPPPEIKAVASGGGEPGQEQLPTSEPITRVATISAPLVAPEPFREVDIARRRAEVAPRALPEGFRMRQEAGVHPSGWPNEITSDRDGAAMVLIPAGEFTMGHNLGRPAERPQHAVTLPAYYIDQHEVTVGQYDSYLKLTGQPPRESDEAEEMPMTGLTWEQAKAYADWAGKALPTEAQWEKAARGVDGRMYPNGSEKPVWDREREPRRIEAVCSHALDLSPLGVFDMAGNVWEWTADWFEARAYQRGAGGARGGAAGQRKGGGRGAEVSVRGGSNEWDVVWRSGMRPEAKLPYLGFRCVLAVEEESPAGNGGRRGDQTPARQPDQRKIVPF